MLEGLDAVRKRPGMYIGSTDGWSSHPSLWEIVDNAVDEAVWGFGDRIDVTINKDGSLTVQDHGRGADRCMHAMGIPTVEVIFTILHAGGKFGRWLYEIRWTYHGVGSSVVNALSSWLEVEITRDGAVYKQRFENGGNCVTIIENRYKAPKSKRHQKDTFMPRDSIFYDRFQVHNTISERLNESAFLLKNVTLSLTDKNRWSDWEFHYENGVQDFFLSINKDKKIDASSFYFEGEDNGFKVEITIVQWRGFR